MENMVITEKDLKKLTITEEQLKSKKQILVEPDHPNVDFFILVLECSFVILFLIFILSSFYLIKNSKFIGYITKKIQIYKLDKKQRK